MKLKFLLEAEDEDQTPKETEADVAAQDAQNPNRDEHAELPQDSLDNLVDAFLIKFESEAVAAAEEDDGMSEGSLKKSFSYLLEAGDDAEEEAPADEDKTDDNAQPHDDAPLPPPEPQAKINIDSFAQGVARLIHNYNSLIDFPKTIFLRSQMYLDKHYGRAAASELEDVLAKQHEIDFGGNNGNAIVVPNATGSEADLSTELGAASGTGGGGGGAAI